MKKIILALLSLPLMFCGCEHKVDNPIKNSNIGITCYTKNLNGEQTCVFPQGETIEVEYSITNLSNDTLWYDYYTSEALYHPEWFDIFSASDGELMGRWNPIILFDESEFGYIPPHKSRITIARFPGAYSDVSLGKSAKALPAGDYLISFTPVFKFYESCYGSRLLTLETELINIKFSVQ